MRHLRAHRSAYLRMRCVRSEQHRRTAWADLPLRSAVFCTVSARGDAQLCQELARAWTVFRGQQAPNFLRAASCRTLQWKTLCLSCSFIGMDTADSGTLKRLTRSKTSPAPRTSSGLLRYPSVIGDARNQPSAGAGCKPCGPSGSWDEPPSEDQHQSRPPDQKPRTLVVGFVPDGALLLLSARKKERGFHQLGAQGVYG